MIYQSIYAIPFLLLGNIHFELETSRMELSRRSGVSARTLEAWGKRMRIPRDVYVLYRVAKALGCSIEDIIEPELAEED